MLAVRIADDLRVPRFIVAYIGAGMMRLGVLNGAPLDAPAIPFKAGAQTFFVGCRRHRPGLKNTLGAMRLSDALVLPNRNIFAEDMQAIRDALTDLQAEVRDAV